MPFVCSRCCWEQSQVLCYWLPLPSWGRMSGLACNRRPLARALLGRAPFRTAWHNDLSTMNWGMGKDGNRTSWGRGYVFTRVGHSSQPPTGGHLRSRVSSINFTSTLSKRLMRRISPLQSVPNVASFPSGAEPGKLPLCVAIKVRRVMVREVTKRSLMDNKRDQQFLRDAEAIPIS